MKNKHSPTTAVEEDNMRPRTYKNRVEPPNRRRRRRRRSKFWRLAQAAPGVEFLLDIKVPNPFETYHRRIQFLDFTYWLLLKQNKAVDRT